MSTESPPALDRPLCVDLDGTLIATDLLWESFLDVVRRRPLAALRAPFWLIAGRPHLKGRIAEHSELDVALLPYRREVIAYLRAQRAAGRRLILATAADASLARRVADHLGLFDEVIAGDGRVNLKGARKLEALRARCGPGGFDYLGDSAADLPLWEAAGGALLVEPGRRLRARASRVCTPQKVFESPGGRLQAAVQALRPHQWVKNILLFVPLLTSHRLTDPRLVLQALLAFAAFCATASAVYLLNDLLDLDSDRRHARKRRRPLAAGLLSIPAALGLGLALLAVAGGLAMLLPPLFGALMAFYLVLTTAYSIWIKRKLMADVLTLAGLYTHRILAGGAALSIVISPWLLAFSSFFFLSLAFAKRYTELIGHAEPAGPVPGRGYLPPDLEMVRSMGPSSGYLCVLVLSLYINSPDVTVLYGRPWVLWFLCPLLLYWLSRIWFLANRGQLPHDPIVFALKDKASYVVGAVGAAVLILAS